MNHESTITDPSQSQFKVLVLNLFGQENKSFILFGDTLKSLFIKIENNKLNLDSLPLIDYATFKYKDYFVKASKIEPINNEMFIFFDLEAHYFLDFSTNFQEGLTPFNLLTILRNYMKILLVLLLLNDDFSLFDPKLFFLKKCPITGMVQIHYLYQGKPLSID